MEFLKSAVASAIAKGSSLPYTFGDRLDNDKSIWTLHNGTKREDGSPCSIFTFDVSSNKSRLPLAKNAARKLRTLRHPGVIKVLDSIETDTNIYLITEKVTPLSWHVKRKSLSEETIKWGLFTVASTIKFVNDDATSVHGAIRVSSIYTSESGEWKLGGFDILSSMKEDDAVIYSCGSLAPDSNRYCPPEVVSGGWSVIKKNPLPALDAYGLGILVYEVFNGGFTGSDQLAQPKNIAPSMVQGYRRLVNANPKLRLSPGNFLEQGQKLGGFFETPLIHITIAADSLGLKSETEREEFLDELDGLSDDFPEEFFKLKILPELLKSVEFGGGGPKVFGAIMKISSKLSDDEFESRVVPVIIRLFSSPDRAMRVCLLDNLPSMIDRLPQKDVNSKIFPMMATGFTDTAPIVRETTVKAVLTIIGKLSDRTVNGELLRHLAKTANDEQPGIRTNTTICLGKIARNLSTSTRSKVLIAAFSKSLRDPFVHARNAALMALNATIDVFSDDDCALKLLPVICMSLVDKEKIVRDQATRTVDNYLARVRKYASTLAETALPPQQATNGTNTMAARMGNQSDTSWAGWAISSFTNKMATARGTIQPSTNGTAQTTTSLPPSGRATPAPSSTSTTHIPPRVPPPTSHPTSASTPNLLDDPTDVDADADSALDAWGTMDDDDETFFDATTSRKRTPSPSHTTATLFDDGGEPDFAGWLAAQSQTKAKRPLPKGLAKPGAAGAGTGLSVRPAATERTISAGGAGLAAGARKLAGASVAARPKVIAPVKKAEVMQNKESANDDDWGDAWD